MNGTIIMETDYYFKIKEETYQQGRADERKKIMEIIYDADDISHGMYLLGRYIIAEQLKEQKNE